MMGVLYRSMDFIKTLGSMNQSARTHSVVREIAEVEGPDSPGVWGPVTEINWSKKKKEMSS